MPGVIAVDLGGTNTRAAYYPASQPPAQRQSRVPTPTGDGAEAVFQCLVETIEAVLPAARDDLRIGVGAPGPLDPYQGIVLDAPNLPGWKDIPLRQRLRARFACPVAIGNDANLAALGEWQYGAARGARNVLYLTLSTGIGGGVIADGHLLLGARGLAAELGHMRVGQDELVCSCGRVGHLEAVASGVAIARAARTRLASGEPSVLSRVAHGPESVTAMDVAHAAQGGDELAVSILTQAGEDIGRHLASLVHAFNPEVIVLGGGMSQIGPLLFDAVDRTLRGHVMHPAYLEGLRLVPAELGDEAGLIGAMIMAREL